MAAPFFCSPQMLLTDLSNLGYPGISDPKCILPNGEQRLKLLAQMAKEIDPAFTDTSPESLAKFWDDRGIHSSEPNKAGFRVPFTASPDRPRDKTAANIFLRSAIDLLFAFRRQRAEASPRWKEDDYEEDPQNPIVSQFDIEAMAQLDTLIKERHVLFPNTLHLLSQQSAKSRSLQRRRPDNNRPTKSNVLPARKKPVKASQTRKINEGMTRDKILANLRTIYRETQDMKVRLAALRKSEENATCELPVESNDSACHDDETKSLDLDKLRQFGNDSQKVADLVDRFMALTAPRLAARRTRDDVAERDPAVEEEFGICSVECQELQESIRNMFGELSQAKRAFERIQQSQNSIIALPQAAIIQEVEKLERRTEAQLV